MTCSLILIRLIIFDISTNESIYFFTRKSEGNVLELNEYSLSLSLLKSCVRYSNSSTILLCTADSNLFPKNSIQRQHHSGGCHQGVQV